MNHLETFNTYRPLLFAIAYRMLASAMDAEDILQEAYLRWEKAQAGPPGNEANVEAPKAYLSAVVTRLCIDQLRSARERREEYIGPWLPEPVVAMPGPGDTVALAESLSMAFLVVLESLAPLERAVYLLREIFDYEYSEIAAIVDKSEANCRQIVTRAKRHLSERRPRFAPPPAERDRLFMQFVQACTEGDMDGLLAILSDDIVCMADGGGKVQAARHPIYGPANVARLLLGLMKRLPPGYSGGFALLNGQPTIVGYSYGQPYFTLTLDVYAGKIHGVYSVVNPDKLKGIPPLAAPADAAS